MERQEDHQWAAAQKIVISSDLIAETKLHLQFLEAVDKNGKLYDGPILQRAIVRYKYFWLPLLAKHMESKSPECMLVVPLDCEWIWHCHRLNPVRYMADCKELFGKILDSHGVVVSSIQGASKKQTEELWKKMYPEEPYELDFDDSSETVANNQLAPIPSTNYDLASAVKRQTSFYNQVSRTFMKDDLFLEEAVKRYKGFLHLIRRNMERKSKNFCVPTYDIDLIWHSHQLHPLSYFNDMTTLLGEVLDHNDMDSDRSKGEKLDVGFTGTTKQWKETFNSGYWRAGAMYRGTAPMPTSGPNTKSALQSPELMFVEILVEIMEVSNYLGNQKGNLVLSISKEQPDLLFGEKRILSICVEAEETQAVVFQCEPNGELLFELLHDSPLDLLTKRSSSKSFGTTSMSLSDMLKSVSKLTTQKRLEFGSGTKPITLGIVISNTPPSPALDYAQKMVTGGQHGDGSGCGPWSCSFHAGGQKMVTAGGCGTTCVTPHSGCGGGACGGGGGACGGGRCGGGGGCGGGRCGGGGCRAGRALDNTSSCGPVVETEDASGI